MFKKFILFCLVALSSLNAPTAALEGAEATQREENTTKHLQYLHPSQRPESVKKLVQENYQAISGNTCSQWGLYNGAESYGLLGIDDRDLIRAYIDRGYAAGQRHFSFLDVGAGDFSWTSKGAPLEVLNEFFFDLEDAQFTLIGVRGEWAKGLDETKQFKMHLPSGKVFQGVTVRFIEIGNFAIENFSDEMHRCGLGDLLGHIDIAVSHWGITHLADPIGTVIDIYNALTPHTGMLLSSTFYGIFGTKPMLDQMTEDDTNRSLYYFGDSSHGIFSDFGNAGALVAGCSPGLQTSDILLLKPDAEPAKISLQYYDTHQTTRQQQNASGVVQRFVLASSRLDEDGKDLPPVPAPFSGHRKEIDGQTMEGRYSNMPAEAMRWLNQFSTINRRVDYKKKEAWKIVKQSHDFLRPMFRKMWAETQADLARWDGLAPEDVLNTNLIPDEEVFFLLKVRASLFMHKHFTRKKKI